MVLGMEDELSAVEKAAQSLAGAAMPTSLLTSGGYEDIVQVTPVDRSSAGTAPASILDRVQSETSSAKQLTIILELNRVQLAKTVYELNNEETQRVGVNLAGGTA